MRRSRNCRPGPAAGAGTRATGCASRPALRPDAPDRSPWPPAGYRCARAVSLEVALHRNHHKVVLRVAEHAPQLLGHSHHLVRRAFHLDRLIDGVHALKETGPDVVADE